MRFNELRRLLDGVTQKMLTQTLWALERDGLVSRTVYPTAPPRVEYGLTTLGIEAGRLICAIADWSGEHAQEILTARSEFEGNVCRIEALNARCSAAPTSACYRKRILLSR